MSNSFGKLLKITTFGESHGAAIGVVIDGFPPGFAVESADFIPYMQARRPGQSRYTSQRREADAVEILSGTFEGKTTGTPITLLIRNTDARTRDYEKIREVFRPGHADYSWQQKFGIRDWRGGGRASARETAVRVAAGALARMYLLQTLNIEIFGYVQQVGDLELAYDNREAIIANPFFCPNQHQVADLAGLIENLRREGDSIGARIKIIARNVPAGLGDPLFDKLGATIAHAMMSIPAVRALEIGDGFAVVSQRGSEHRDEMTSAGFLSNHAGGILGGIATGQDICISLALKPASSIVKSARSLNIRQEEVQVSTTGRHDPCVGIRAVPVAESMLALVLMDHYLRHKAQIL